MINWFVFAKLNRRKKEEKKKEKKKEKERNEMKTRKAEFEKKIFHTVYVSFLIYDMYT